MVAMLNFMSSVPMISTVRTPLASPVPAWPLSAAGFGVAGAACVNGAAASTSERTSCGYESAS